MEKTRQASIDTGILKFKNNCIHQLAEGCSSLSGVSNNDGGNWGEVEATAGSPRWAVDFPRQNITPPTFQAITARLNFNNTFYS